MPTHLLPVEHCTQEHAAGCLAACGQMVLRFMGIEQTQHRLNQLLGLTSIGVPYTHITRLARLGVDVTIAQGDQIRLQHALEQNRPLIAFLFTGELPYWQKNTPMLSSWSVSMTQIASSTIPRLALHPKEQLGVTFG